jgi:glycosyltransferase involved in cell wall biosynthesis
MACGAAVVATAVGGISEQIQEGKTGFIVPAGSAEAMADRICALLCDRDLQHSISTAARTAIVRHYDLRSMADAYLDWYATILEHRSSCQSSPEES